MLLATYDYISRLLGIPLFCPFAGNGCDIVQNSRYAVLLGIPLAFLGILGFAAYMVLAFAGMRRGPQVHRYLYALLALNVVVVSSMAYFAYLQVAIIHAVCSLCMFSAALNVAMGVMTVYALCVVHASATVRKA
jgi:uncharacterized membrane protein